MEKNELYEIWNYFLSLEKDFSETSRYIEPKGQEQTHSFEFAKILILACTEAESIIKKIAFICEGKTLGNMGEYKAFLMTKYCKIVTAEVGVSRLGRKICPFAEWKDDGKKLSWWEAYTNIKHHRAESFGEASYINACTAMCGLYILILYLSKITQIEIGTYNTIYFSSPYVPLFFVSKAPQNLPDFQNKNSVVDEDTIDLFSVDNYSNLEK